MAFGDISVEINGQEQAGQVKIWYGSKTGLNATRGMTKITQASARIPDDPEELDYFGFDVAIGDVNGNGRAELAIGITGEVVASKREAGMVVVIYGDAKGIVTSTARIETFTQNSSGVQDDPETHDFFGGSLAFRDFDGDGRNELQIGALFENALQGSVTILDGTTDGLSGQFSQTYTAKNTGIGDQPARYGLALDR
ncbi:FG-GAP repeat protein [Tenggerimyces flavus]|uniref:FG-GAP repeat protein n=1 Tax=Tenggerimyces flavus TaxID=1708749 RepID=A0ABV7YJ34_9ACTN|nr:FG-GAP repeat protein [Tenggerimyces flavus]MBM7787496.1 hypothetical protein [Tenggerimyces flavus]